MSSIGDFFTYGSFSIGGLTASILFHATTGYLFMWLDNV